MLPINIIHGIHPKWVQIVSFDKKFESIICLVNPPLPGDLPGKTYKLHIRRQNGVVTVAEDTPGAELPPFCPARHINFDGTFCIGLDAGQDIESFLDTSWWWDTLKRFLQVQQASEKLGYWPSHLGLSHGDAARYQFKLEALVAGLEWEKEVIASLQYGKGWLSGELPRITKDQKLANQRSPCPRGCKKANKPISIRRCPYRQKVEALISLELQRRESEHKYVQKIKSGGFRCCKSISQCSLK